MPAAGKKQLQIYSGNLLHELPKDEVTRDSKTRASLSLLLSSVALSPITAFDSRVSMVMQANEDNTNTAK